MLSALWLCVWACMMDDPAFAVDAVRVLGLMAIGLALAAVAWLLFHPGDPS